MRAAVDAYSWLHKGAYSCALTRQGITIGESKIETHRTSTLHTSSEHVEIFCIDPVIVFDGDDCQRKRARKARDDKEEKKRNRKDESGWNKAIEKARRLCLLKFRHFAEHGIGVNYGAEERRDRICRGSIRGGRANSAFGEAIEGNGGVDVVFTEDLDLIADTESAESLFQVG